MVGSSSNPGTGGGADWRAQLPPDVRQRVITKSVEVLLKHLPTTTPQGLGALEISATKFEEKIYSVATSQSDYLQRIVTRMVALDSMTPNPQALQQALISRQPDIPLEMQQQNGLLLGQSNNLLSMQQQPSASQRDQVSEDMLQQQTNSNQQRQFTQAQRGMKEATSNSHHFDQVDQRSMKTRGNDRITDLPDAILQHIMSFLPAPEVVRTSVLSPRWRNLWASVPCLDMDIDQFGGRRKQFCRFAHCLLLFRSAAPLKTLSIRSSALSNANCWIKNAIKQNVQVLEFSEDIEGEPFKLEHGIVAFKSQNLKSLMLGNVFLDANVFGPLNYACPVLEKLELRDSSLEVPEISSSSLMHLDITNCCLFEDLLICTPNVVSLCFKNPRYRAATIKKLPSLMVAVISLDEYLHCSDEVEEGEEINCDYSIFDGLSEARSLELLARQREVAFDREILTCPVFNNLTNLSLGEWCMSAELSPLVCFLRCSPLLENLTLKLNMEVCQFCLEEEPTSFPEGTPFTVDHLKKVTVYFGIGDRRIDTLFKLLTPIAKSLEEIELIPSEQPGSHY